MQSLDFNKIGKISTRLIRVTTAIRMFKNQQ